MDSITAFLNRTINAVLGRGLLDQVIVDDILVAENANSKMNTEGLILEAKVSFNPISGIKHYTYRIDKQQGEGGPGRQRHIHIFYDGNELFAMNADSTAHDGYHQVRIPDEISTFLNSKGFPVPANNIIELRIPTTTGTLLYEGLDYAAITRFAVNAGEKIRKARVITIIEANVETWEVKLNTKVRHNYEHVNQLDDVPQEFINEVKKMLIDMLKFTGKYRDEHIDIFNGEYDTPHRLFVAWS